MYLALQSHKLHLSLDLRRAVDGSVGAVGDALDNALAESVIGLFKPN